MKKKKKKTYAPACTGRVVEEATPLQMRHWDMHSLFGECLRCLTSMSPPAAA